MASPLFSGEELYKLIPQRPPICMVDTVWSATQEQATTGLTIADNNIFLQDGQMQMPGLIEHIAQSAAAFAGYSTYLRGESPRLGYIGEIKKCHILMLPPQGAALCAPPEDRSHILIRESPVRSCAFPLFFPL